MSNQFLRPVAVRVKVPEQKIRDCHLALSAPLLFIPFLLSSLIAVDFDAWLIFIQ